MIKFEDSEKQKDVFDPLINLVFADKYRIVHRLGEGSMATVYKGYDIIEHRHVAVKILHSHLTRLAPAVARFEQECKSTSLVTHPNVVTVYDSGVSNGRHFMVMEFIDGTSLADVIRTRGVVEPAVLLDIFVQVCGALSAAHYRGVIHRDLKPANILLSIEPHGKVKVKLVDFGIAHVLPNLGETHFRCTQSGEMLGSLLYMSPEQCLENDIDKRSDIYSLGCIFYEALTGTPPMAGRTAFETINKHLSAMPQPISELNPSLEIPDGMEPIILKALEKKPADRFQSAGALQKELELLRRGELPLLVRIRRAELASKAKSRSRFLFMSVSSMLGTVAGVALYFAWQTIPPVAEQRQPVIQQSPPVIQQSPPLVLPVVEQTPTVVQQSSSITTTPLAESARDGADGQDGMDGNASDALDINPTEQEEKDLLSPSAHDFAKNGAFLKSPNTGIIRLLPREKYEGKLRINGSGAYYSFARRVQEYGYGSDIELQNNNFRVGFAGGDFGFFTTLKDTPLKSVDISTPGMQFLADSMLPSAAHQSAKTQQGEFSYSYKIPAQINTTYVVRSIVPGRSDVLVAFRPVRQDKDGSMIILWKMIKAYPVPAR